GSGDRRRSPTGVGFSCSRSDAHLVQDQDEQHDCQYLGGSENHETAVEATLESFHAADYSLDQLVQLRSGDVGFAHPGTARVLMLTPKTRPESLSPARRPGGSAALRC